MLLKPTILLLLFMPCYCFSQSRKEVKGIIVDSVKNNPIPFANIYLKHSMEGTFTNYEGKFIFKFDSLASKDTLTISHIGFKSIELPVSKIDFSDTLRIFLAPSNTTLSEVTVYSSDLAKQIVKSAFENINKNYPVKRHYYSAFFRETIIQNKKSVRLVEAAVHIEDPGYKKDVVNIRMSVDQLRRSSDYSDKTLWEKATKLFFGNSNSLYDTYESNNIRRYLSNKKDPNLIYGDRFFKINDFYKTGETYIGLSKILIIDYEQKGHRDKQLMDTTRTHYFPQGRIFINATDNAIVRMEDWFGSILKRDNSFSEAFTIEGQYTKKVTYEFKKNTDGKYYLGWIEKIELKTNNKFNHCLLFINEIPFDNLRSMKVKSKFLFSKDIDLYDADVKYNEEFWENYNGVLMNPINDKILRDLQNIRPLKDQFRKN